MVCSTCICRWWAHALHVAHWHALVGGPPYSFPLGKFASSVSTHSGHNPLFSRTKCQAKYQMIIKGETKLLNKVQPLDRASNSEGNEPLVAPTVAMMPMDMLNSEYADLLGLHHRLPRLILTTSTELAMLLSCSSKELFLFVGELLFSFLTIDGMVHTLDTSPNDCLTIRGGNFATTWPWYL